MKSLQNVHPRIRTRKNKQDRQCTYNVTIKRVPATIVAVEKR